MADGSSSKKWVNSSAIRCQHGGCAALSAFRLLSKGLPGRLLRANQLLGKRRETLSTAEQNEPRPLPKQADMLTS
jgi:hypothetical protein